MNASRAERVLQAWERGLAASAFERPSVVLSAFGRDSGQLPAMTLGERDRALFVVRHELFGERVAATVSCGQCGERLQIGFELHDVIGDGLVDPPARLAWNTADNVEMIVRVPRVADMQCATAARDAGDARRILLERVVESVSRAGSPLRPQDLSPLALAEIDAQLERADPDANVALRAECPECGYAAEYPFDIAAFLWTEIATEAIRLLREVHQLARGYGWRESDILAMSPLRRQAYLQMLPA